MRPSPDRPDHPSRILIVDDEPLNRQVLQVMLAAEGFFIQTAADGEEALALVAEQSPDLIVLDVMLPAMNGYEVTSQIKENPATKNIPIIMVTALDDGQARMRGLIAGAEDFLTKPVDRAELCVRVRNLLRLKVYGDFYGMYSERLEGEVASRTVDLVQRTHTLEQQAIVLADQAAQLEAGTRDLARALERAEQANRAKDTLLMTVSHELRTPLTAILGWSDILARHADPALVQRGLPVIRRNAKALVQEVEDLLDASRLDTGRMQLEPRPTDLRAIVAHTFQVVRPAAEAKGISMASTHDESPAVVLGDPVRLQQVMWNLLSNAVKFTPEGGTVHVSLQSSTDRVRLQVSDNGIGIESSFLSKVFDHFTQADMSTTRQQPGLGLGLTIVRQLVEMQGGTIQVLSEGRNQGTAFVVELPLYKGVADPINAAETFSELPERIDLSGMRVLVVDDDADSRATVALILETAGASTMLAESASTGLQCLLDHDVDIVVSDILMPHHDGIAFIQDVRRLLDDVKRRVPAVALTALARDEDRQWILAAGFQKDAAKPVSADHLVRCVAAAAAA